MALVKMIFSTQQRSCLQRNPSHHRQLPSHHRLHKLVSLLCSVNTRICWQLSARRRPEAHHLQDQSWRFICVGHPTSRKNRQSHPHPQPNQGWVTGTCHRSGRIGKLHSRQWRDCKGRKRQYQHGFKDTSPWSTRSCDPLCTCWCKRSPSFPLRFPKGLFALSLPFSRSC